MTQNLSTDHFFSSGHFFLFMENLFFHRSFDGGGCFHFVAAFIDIDNFFVSHRCSKEQKMLDKMKIKFPGKMFLLLLFAAVKMHKMFFGSIFDTFTFFPSVTSEKILYCVVSQRGRVVCNLYSLAKRTCQEKAS